MKKYLKNLLLCIKYPFLIPRNRFSGKIINGISFNFINKLYHKAYYPNILISINDDSSSNDTGIFIVEDNDFSYSINNDYLLNIHCIKTKEEKTVDLSLNFSNGRKLVGLSHTNTFGGNPIIKVLYKKEEKFYGGYSAPCIRFKRNKFLAVLYQICNWIAINIINKLPIIYFTELDALETGWRKAFGEDICKEIKHSLLYTVIREENISKKTPFRYFKAYLKGIKYLHRYRIDQIKEKWGYLHWYDSWATTDVQRIIDKYEDISYHTCISCGKPAKYISTGWISPYCEDCIDPNRNYEEIGEDKLI